MVSGAVHGVLLFLVKISILLLYLRLFHASKKMKISIYLTAFFVLAHSVAGTAYGIARSLDVIKAFDNPTSQPGKTRDWLFTFWGVCNIVTDFLVLMLPIPTVWGLHLGTRQNILLLGIFMTGTL